MSTIKTSIPMNIHTLDTMRIGCDDSIKNGVNIPINPNYCKQEYKETYKAIQEQVSGHTKGEMNLDLHVIAKDGHDFHSYDNEYDYYYAAYMKDSAGKYILATIPAELTQLEQDIVNKVVYANRDRKKALRVYTERLVKSEHPDLMLFLDGIHGNTYKAVWQSVSGDVTIIIYVTDIETTKQETHIKEYKIK